MRKQSLPLPKGFTIIELVITIAVLGIVITLAAPSFQRTIAANRAQAVSMDLASALMQARAEAVKRATKVTLCKSVDVASNANPTCTSASGTSWANGWVSFTDAGTAGSIDGSDARLKMAQPNIGSGTLTSSDSNFGNFISFDSRGAVISSGGASTTTFSICITPSLRTIQISPMGRIHTDSGSC
ncbi:GspH/FimT family pseudopilin [Dechloromonas hankyongensis]|uniref:GspH/FimT family pseudopilin n=1 Tax=Dechloromonas hankyongensis TaxID=2908002 RepID=UPI003B8455E0